MAIELRRLVQKASHLDITLVAGKDGAHNLVSWVHMVETLEATTFLDGGEVAFITGLGLSNTTLLTMVKYLKVRKVAGIIVNLGPFIDEIPLEVIEYCNKNSFPIYSVPWRIHIAEIMRIFCQVITKSDQTRMEICAAFKNAIFFPKQEELYSVSLSQRGFNTNWNYNVCVVKLNSENPVSAERIEKLSDIIDNYIKHNKYKNYAVFSKESEIVIVSGNYTESTYMEFVNKLRTYIPTVLTKEETVSFGCGKRTKSIRCVYKSYNQASSIQKLHAIGKMNPDQIFYQDMGIYKLLMSIADREILDEYIEKTILPLQEYDKSNDSDLMEVLTCYLKNNGSVKDTANELFVHRNTINYKVKKISELLNMDLSSLEDRLQLSVALMVKNIMP